MTTWNIDTGHGTELAAGMDERTARQAAQRMANERSESVYLYPVPCAVDEDGEGTGEDVEEFAPEKTTLE